MTSKKMKTILSWGVVLILLAGVVQSCKRDDDPDPDPAPPIPAYTVLAKKTTNPPTIDGTIDGMWANIPVMTTTTRVPNLEASSIKPGCGVFGGYEGDEYTVKIRSIYDAGNIYFLVEWNDPVRDLDRQSWYFDATTKRWKQEDKYGCSNGTKKHPYYEDKFSFMWNINQHAGDWEEKTCYTNCHSGLSTPPWPDKVKHFTNAPGEMADVWHWKSVRTDLNYQIDDQRWIYADINNPADPANGGRGGDAKTGGGYSDNKQTLELSDDAGVMVSVPKYVVPGKTNYYWITQTEVNNGNAKLITSVNSNGVLFYDGGSIDPNGDNGYASATGNKRFPSIHHANGPFVGSRGDVIAKANHTGSGWVLEIKRALNTGNDDDVVFDIKNKYKFGIGVFENAGIAHAIKTNLTLTFEQ